MTPGFRRAALVGSTAILALGLIACNGAARADSDQSASLTRTQAIAEVNDLVAGLQSAHPNLYFREQKAELDARVQTVESRFTESIRVTDLYRAVEPVVTSIGDAHTSIDPYLPDYIRYRDAGGRLFPLELRFYGSYGVVIANYGPEYSIPLGAHVLGIDGKAVTTLLDELGKYESGENSALKQQFIANDLRVLMWIDGMNPPYRVEFASPPSAILTTTLQGATVTDIHRWDSSPTGVQQEGDCNLRLFEGGQVAVLASHSFQADSECRSSFGGVFKRLRHSQTKSLIIDIRENTGGDTRVADALMNYITARPYRDFSEISMRSSAFVKRRLGRNNYVEIYGTEAWGAPDGQIVHLSIDYSDPEPELDRFHGRVYILTGPGTYSTAVVFAAAAQDAHAATIVGQETAGSPTFYGEAFPFELPRSGLNVTVSTKYFIGPSGIRSTRGVIPSISLQASPQAGNDTELTAAIQIATSGR